MGTTSKKYDLAEQTEVWVLSTNSLPTKTIGKKIFIGLGHSIHLRYLRPTYNHEPSNTLSH